MSGRTARTAFQVLKIFIRTKGSHISSEELNLSVVLHRSNDVELEIRPIPIPRENELLIRVGYVCLSDIDIRNVTKGPAPSMSYEYRTSYVLGNHASGIVVGAGIGVEENFKEGDRVALEPGISCHECHYCMQERYNLCADYTLMGTAKRSGAMCRFIAHPMRNCHKIPQHIGLDDAALCTRLGSAIHACRRAGVNKHSTIAIIGSGFTGTTTALTCKLMGIKNVIFIEFSEYRLGVAKSFGAEYVLKYKPHADPEYLKDIIQEIVGRQPDITFDTVASSETLCIASTITKSGGQVMLTGQGATEEVRAIFHHIAYREIDIKGVYNAGQCFQEAVQMIKGGLIRAKDLNPIIVPLEHALEAFNNARINIGANAVVMIECFKETKL